MDSTGSVPEITSKSKKILNSDEEKEIEAIKSNFSCAICLSITQEPCMTPCGHLFCSLCIKTWIQKNFEAVCPKCRTLFTIESIVHISNGFSSKPKKINLPKKRILKAGFSSLNIKFGNLIIYQEENRRQPFKSVVITTLTCLLLIFCSEFIVYILSF